MSTHRTIVVDDRRYSLPNDVADQIEALLEPYELPVRRGNPLALFVYELDEQKHADWVAARNAKGYATKPLQKLQQFPTITALAEHLGMLATNIRPYLRHGRKAVSQPLGGAVFQFEKDYDD